jgi:transposase
MGTHPGLFSADGQAGCGAKTRQTGNRKRHFLPQQDGLPVADVAERFPALANRVRPLAAVEPARSLGGNAGCLERNTPKKNGKRPAPGYGIVDSQSVKTVAASEGRGYDGNKKTKGRKRHVVVDTLGNLTQVLAHAANEHDSKAGCGVLKAAADKHASLEAFSGDAGCRGTAVEFVETALKLKLHISQKIKDAFAVLPTRWIVERTFAWLGNYRRLAKDFEILTQSAENMVRIAMIQVTLAKCL